jgi:hypothetical protein
MTTSTTNATAFKDLVVRAEGLDLPPTQLVDIVERVDLPTKSELLQMLEARDIVGKWRVFHALTKVIKHRGLVDHDGILQTVLFHIEADIEKTEAITTNIEELEGLKKLCGDNFVGLAEKIRKKITREQNGQVPLITSPDELIALIEKAKKDKDLNMLVLAGKQLSKVALDLIDKTQDPDVLEKIIYWPTYGVDPSQQAHFKAIVLCGNEDLLIRLGNAHTTVKHLQSTTSIIAWEKLADSDNIMTLKAVVEAWFDERPNDRAKPRTQAINKIMQSMKTIKDKEAKMETWFWLGAKAANKAGDPNDIRRSVAVGLLHLVMAAAKEGLDANNEKFVREVLRKALDEQKQYSHQLYDEVRKECVRTIYVWKELPVTS